MSAGEVGWRTGIQPWRFRLNSFPANRLQARPTAAFRTSIPAQVLGGLAWRSQLAESAGGVACRTAPAGATPRIGAGGVCWRCLLAVSVGGVCWRCLVAVFVGGVCWRCLLAVSLGGVAWRCRLAESAGGLSWRSQLVESVGGVSWRSQLAESVGGVAWRTAPVGATPQIGAAEELSAQARPRNDRAQLAPPSWRSGLAVSAGGLDWRSQLAESVGGVSWRTGLQPGRFRLNSFPANRLQERPTAVFELPSRLRCLAAGLGGVGWRSRLAESAGGVGWRCRLAVSVGGVRWRSRLSDRTSWGHPPDWTRRGTVRSSGTEKRSCPTRPSQLAEWVGRAAWRCPLAESAGGPLLGRSLLQFDRTVSSGVSSDGERHSWSSGLFGKR